MTFDPSEIDLPWLSDTLFLNNTLTIWLIALLAALGAYFTMRTLLGFLHRKLQALHGNGTHRLRLVLPQVIDSTSKLVLLATALLIGATLLDLTPRWEKRVDHLWFLALGLQLALWANTAISLFAAAWFSNGKSSEPTPTTVSKTLIIWAVQTLVWVVFFLAALSNLGVNITAFVASLGIGGVAIALAVQNILGDLFASLSIAVDKPFEVGDAINVNGNSGTVERVGLKSTRIRATSGEQIIIANAELLKATLFNYKRQSTRRIQFDIRLALDTPGAIAAQVPDLIKRLITAQPQLNFDRAHLRGFGAQSLDFEVVYIVATADYGVYMDAQQQIHLQLLSELEKLGAQLALPVQVVRTAPTVSSAGAVKVAMLSLK